MELLLLFLWFWRGILEKLNLDTYYWGSGMLYHDGDSKKSGTSGLLRSEFNPQLSPTHKLRRVDWDVNSTEFIQIQLIYYDHLNASTEV